MRKVIYAVEVILLIIVVGAMLFLNMNAARISSISCLEDEPNIGEVKSIYLELLQNDSEEVLTREEKYLLSQSGITLVDEEIQKCEIRKEGIVLNIYNPKIFKKSRFLYEIYYLTEQDILVRNSDGKALEDLSKNKQILENPD